MGFLKLILGFLSGGPLDRILSTVDRKFQNDVSKEKLKADVTTTFIQAAALSATQRDPLWRLMQLIVLLPLAFWFGAVCVYSVLWCADCAYPKEWTIAALPEPLATWGGGIIASLFVMVGAERIMKARK